MSTAPTPHTAHAVPVPPAERELRIVNFDLLEEEAKKNLSPGRFAVMGPAGDVYPGIDGLRFGLCDRPVVGRHALALSDVCSAGVESLAPLAVTSGVASGGASGACRRRVRMTAAAL